MSDFVTFDEFLKRTKAARPDEARPLTGAAVDPAAFEAMRAHVLSLYEGVQVAHSFMLPDGQYVDCIPIEQQPGLRRAGKRQQVAAPPPAAPGPSAAPAAAGQQRAPEGVAPQLSPGMRDAHGNEQCCPPGTIPMRRVTLQEIARFRNLKDFFQKGGVTKGHPRLLAAAAVPHRYAHAYQVVNNNGGSSELNLWSPTPTPNNFSLSQHWYSGGSGNSLQTVEAGWQVYPAKYGTSNAVLFIYWTADGYNNTGAYNLDQTGFVQVNNSWVLGGTFDQYSVRDGEQREFRVHWQRDTSNGNWWLFLQGGGDLTAVGYYPQSLFGSGQMASNATDIDYGGEVTGATSGQMGSGAFASEGWQRAAYQRQVFNIPTSGPTAWANLTAVAATPTCYTIDLHNNNPDDWATYFFFGGPSCG